MVYIATETLPITRETIMSNARNWLRMVKYGESGIVTQFQIDNEYRVGEIIADESILKDIFGKEYQNYLLGHVTIGGGDMMQVLADKLDKMSKKIGIDEVDNSEDLGGKVKYLVKKGYHVGLFVRDLGELIRPKHLEQLREIEILLENTHNFSVVGFCDHDVVREEYREIVNRCSLLFDHVMVYPLYEESDARQFVAYNNSMWKMNLSPHVESKIIANCGGYLWLISHVQRFFRDHEELPWEIIEKDAGLMIKLKAIVGKLNAEELRILKAVTESKLSLNQKESRAYEYLLQLRLLRKEGNKIKLGVPLLELVIGKSWGEEALSVDQDGKVLLEGKDIEVELSESEKMILRLLVRKKKRLVKREEIAKSVWGGEWEEKYSDWALDRLIYRLRLKLEELEVDKNVIQTLKRRGYRLG